MQTNNRFLPGLRQFIAAALSVFILVPASGQQSFFMQYSGPQQLQGGGDCNAGITPNGSGYYFGSMNYLLETDQAGHVQWAREFWYNNARLGLIAMEDRAGGGYYGGGFVYDQALMAFRNIILRLDTSGNTIWTKEVQLSPGSGQLIRLATAADGGLGICATSMQINGQAGAWVGKTDSLGNLLWGKVIGHGPLNLTYGTGIAPTRDGGFIVTSKVTMSNTSALHTGLSRLDVNGNLLWTKTFEGSGANNWAFATQCDDGGFAVAGSTNSLSTDGFRLFRTDSLGNLLWSTGYFHMPSMGYAQKVQETADRGFIISGNILDLSNLWFYPLMIRTDSLGNTRWARKMIFNNYCGATSWDVQETPDGGFLMPVAELSLIKTDQHGDINCVSFPVTIIEVDTMVSQTSSLDFVNGGSVIPITIINAPQSFTDSTHCAGEFSPTAITVHDVADELSVYPNPSEGLFTLQIENGNASYDVAVYNSIGQLVRRYKNASSQIEIDLTAAADGIYFVRVTASDATYSRVVRLLKK